MSLAIATLAFASVGLALASNLLIGLAVATGIVVVAMAVCRALTALWRAS